MAIQVTSRPTNAQALSALVSLIASATKIVETHFLSSKEGGYIPSLDDTEEHPLDSQISPPDVRQAIQTIEAACAQLCATVVKPKMTMVNRTLENYGPPCLNAAVEFNVADALLDKPQGMHIDDLATAVGVNVDKLSRILRLLATKHIFREVSPDVFANNRLSMQLLSQNPISSYAWTFTGDMGKLTGEITNVLKDPVWGASRDPRQTAFNRYTCFSGNVFEYMDSGKGPCDSHGQPKTGPQFALAMVGLADATEVDSVVHEYPWHELPQGASVCDLGGGVGHMLMKIGRAHPHLQLRLQDIPERITQARDEIWPQQFPEALEENRVEFAPINFFTESPILNCDIYFLKYIIHDWADAFASDIMKNIRRAMAPHSRVLIYDYLIQHVSRGTDNNQNDVSLPEAPKPLLPNYGIARIRQYAIDMAVMGLFNGTERVLKDVLRLAEGADLHLVKVWDLGELALLELRAGDGLNDGL